VQGPLSRRQARGRALPAEAEQAAGRGEQCQLTEARQFNLMFRTTMGALEGRGERGLPAARDGAGDLRELPQRAAVDAAEGPVRDRADRQGVPQRDHAGNFIFRTREFEQMEMQFFVDPNGDHMQWFEYWKAERMKWHHELGLRDERLHFHQHGEGELAHYARAAFDIEFDFGGTLGFQEIEGVHHRGDFDLGRIRSTRERSSSTSTSRTTAASCRS
jgi:glycyl-tRNA synthetase